MDYKIKQKDPSFKSDKLKVIIPAFLRKVLRATKKAVERYREQFTLKGIIAKFLSRPSVQKSLKLYRKIKQQKMVRPEDRKKRKKRKKKDI